MKAIFLDRDGTLNYGIPRYARIDSPDKVELLPNTLEALSQLAKLNYQVFIVTNQAGIAEGLITQDEFWQINDKLLELIQPSGITITKTYLCPHGENNTCDCRKPKPKLLQDGAKEFGIDLSQSWMIGDRDSDIQCGQNAGVKTIHVMTGETSSPPQTNATFTCSSLLEAAEFLAQQN